MSDREKVLLRKAADLQASTYGNGTSLHLAMIPLADEIRAALAQPSGESQPVADLSTWLGEIGVGLTDYQCDRIAEWKLFAHPQTASLPVIYCPNCDGSGESSRRDSAGPDGQEVPCNCPHCNGHGSIEAAYHGVCELLRAEQKKYLEACGQIWAARHLPKDYPAHQQPATLSDEQIDRIMEQAQVFASAWSIVGGRFDSGDGLENAENEKANLRAILAQSGE